jgi:hypothetical protein
MEILLASESQSLYPSVLKHYLKALVLSEELLL